MMIVVILIMISALFILAALHTSKKYPVGWWPTVVDMILTVTLFAMIAWSHS